MRSTLCGSTAVPRGLPCAACRRHCTSVVEVNSCAAERRSSRAPVRTHRTHPGASVTTPDWPYEVSEQLRWHWAQQLRPRLTGLSDDEYFWEPTPDSWSVHPRGQSRAPIQAGSGAFTIDFALPEPNPPPVTTIAWRLGHLIVGVLGMRASNHFGDRSIDYQTFDYAGTATGALRQLDEVYAAWTDGVRALGIDGLARPCGPDEGPFADLPMAALVLHISRETIHHGAEITLLRDLYRHQTVTTSRGAPPGHR